MAKFYGGSHYLLKNDLKNYGWAVGLVLLPLVLVWMSLKFLAPGVTLVAVIICIAFVAKFSDPFIGFFKKKSNRFYRGWGGELDIYRELRDLPDEYSVYQDIMLGEGKGNLDFVLVGPTGIFNFEVKSHTGIVEYNGYSLTLNGRNFREKNILRQVHGQTWALKQYLKKETGTDVFIYSAIVFSSDRVGVHFGLRPVENVYIVQKSYLMNLVHSFRNTPVNRGEIEKALRKLVSA